MNALELMTPRPHVVTPGDPLTRAARIMRDHDVGAVPVVDGRASMRPVGIITDRDVVLRHVALGHHGDGTCLGTMTPRPLVCVRPHDGVDKVMRAMELHRVRRVLVVDGDGRLVGIVAQADLLRGEGRAGPVRVERVLERSLEPTLLPV
jgi:CBS domain-containing protein